MQITKTNKTLSRREMSKLIKNKNTINLSNIDNKNIHLSNLDRRIKARHKKNTLKIKGLIVLIILTIALGLFQYKVYGDIEPIQSTKIEVQEELDPLEQLLNDNPEIEEVIQKQTTYEKRLLKFVEQGEGAFQGNAFCDSYYRTKYGLIRKKPKDCTRWSIGFGTKSYWGEKITLKEAIKRKDKDILRRDKLITSNCLTDNQKIVAVDYMYQHGINSGLVKHYVNTCQQNRIYNHIVWLRDKYRKARKWGLVKREQIRINYFYN